MIEWLRDKTRDNLSRDLRSLGLTTLLARRGRPEEKIERTRFQRSLGIIDIVSGGSIKWVNVLKKGGGENNPPQWRVVFGIPDERPIQQAVNIKTIRRKTFPLFGKVVDVAWQGNDGTTGLIDLLSSDEDVNVLAKGIGNLVICSHADDFRGWTLQVDRRLKPNSRNWATIQKVAKYLLSARHDV